MGQPKHPAGSQSAQQATPDQLAPAASARQGHPSYALRINFYAPTRSRTCPRCIQRPLVPGWTAWAAAQRSAARKTGSSLRGGKGREEELGGCLRAASCGWKTRCAAQGSAGGSRLAYIATPHAQQS